MKHIVKELNEYDRKDEYKWAVLWKDIIVCICPDEEWARQIAWALDFAKPYSGQEND